jgi:hypothetical protein
MAELVSSVQHRQPRRPIRVCEIDESAEVSNLVHEHTTLDSHVQEGSVAVREVVTFKRIDCCAAERPCSLPISKHAVR